MSSWLLLALALLGSASARRPGAAEGAVRCPPESQVTRLTLPAAPGAPGATTYHYAVVQRCESFRRAQAVCSQCYRGRLASVHSNAVNTELQRCAHGATARGRVWIGAVTRPLGRNVFCQWVDHTLWNYAHWLQGYPLLSGTLCTALCTANGLWRNSHCGTRLPFICEY